MTVLRRKRPAGKTARTSIADSHCSAPGGAAVRQSGGPGLCLAIRSCTINPPSAQESACQGCQAVGSGVAALVSTSLRRRLSWPRHSVALLLSEDREGKLELSGPFLHILQFSLRVMNRIIPLRISHLTACLSVT